jgi:hypothetical protein
MGQEGGNTQKLSEFYRNENKELSIPAKGNNEQAYSRPERLLQNPAGSSQLTPSRLHVLKPEADPACAAQP